VVSNMRSTRAAAVDARSIQVLLERAPHCGRPGARARCSAESRPSATWVGGIAKQLYLPGLHKHRSERGTLDVWTSLLVFQRAPSSKQRKRLRKQKGPVLSSNWSPNSAEQQRGNFNNASTGQVFCCLCPDGGCGCKLPRRTHARASITLSWQEICRCEFIRRWELSSYWAERMARLPRVPGLQQFRASTQAHQSLAIRLCKAPSVSHRI